MSRALKIDLLFNYASLGVLAASGLVMNLVVVRVMGDAALGVFNQAYAVYIAASQLAVGGVHLSVLRSVAQSSEDPRERAPVIASGLLLSFALGVALCLAVLLTRGFWGRLLESPAVSDALVFVGPALIPFSLNKTLLAALNALERMRTFAGLQTLRFLVMLLVLGAVAWKERPPAELSACFLFAEALVSVVAFGCLRACVRFGRRDVARSWLRCHLSFGARGLLSGVFMELNTRIDVLVIGVFASDQDVGRYSLAAVFAEGLYQCLIVVKNQLNPVLAQLLVKGTSTQIRELVHRAWRYVYPGMALAYLAGLGVFWLLLRFQLQLSEPSEALACYAILGLGVLAVSGFVPFDGILLFAGKPAHYTLFTFSIAISNLALNLLFVPLLGIRGAALGTALALGLSIASLSLIMRRELGFSYMGRSPARG